MIGDEDGGYIVGVMGVDIPCGPYSPQNLCVTRREGRHL